MITTPFQNSADDAMQRSWDSWQRGEILASFGNSLYARLGYLADMIASIVLLPLSLIGMAFGAFQALFIWSVQDASFLNSSYDLCTEKVERFFASALGAIFSPACGFYFRERKITPMALGLVTTGLVSYMVMKNPPSKIDWTFGIGK